MLELLIGFCGWLGSVGFAGAVLPGTCGFVGSVYPGLVGSCGIPGSVGMISPVMGPIVVPGFSGTITLGSYTGDAGESSEQADRKALAAHKEKAMIFLLTRKPLKIPKITKYPYTNRKINNVLTDKSFVTPLFTRMGALVRLI